MNTWKIAYAIDLDKEREGLNLWARKGYRRQGVPAASQLLLLKLLSGVNQASDRNDQYKEKH